MLSREAVHSAWALTEKLDEAGLRVVPVENTPLAALVAASRPPTELLLTPNGTCNIDLDLIDHMANSPMAPGVIGSQHDLVMDEITPVAFEAIRNHIHFARTVVSPLVESLSSSVRQALADQTSSSLLGMEVIVVETPEIYTNDALRKAAEKFEDVSYDNPDVRTRLGELDAAGVRELITTGSAAIDKDIDLWLDYVGGDGWLVATYNQAFRAMFCDYAITFADMVRQPADALFVFLAARKLCEAAPPEGTEMPLQQYETTMVEMRNQAAKQVMYHINCYADELKQGRMITDSNDRQAWVHADLYRKWINEGGSNEILFGNLLNKPVLVTVANITERATDLLAAWQKHSVYVTSLEANRRFERTKTFLGMHFHKQLGEEQNEANYGNATQVYDRFQELLDNVREGELECLDSVCLRLVCKSRFPHTAAFDILDGINTAMKQNAELDAREAAAISMAKYIGRWVASLFRVEA